MDKHSPAAGGQPIFEENQPALGDNLPAFGDNPAVFPADSAVFGGNQPVFGDNPAVFPADSAAFGDNPPLVYTEVAKSQLIPHMSPRQQASAQELCPDWQGVLLYGFPYFAGDAPGNLSLYARGRDYHALVLAYLREEGERLTRLHPCHAFVAACDDSPLPEKTAARLGGVGMVGSHSLIIVPPYGSYVFFGELLTTLPIAPREGRSAPPCQRCGACVRACPTGAIVPLEDGRTQVLRHRCVAAITQKRGELSTEEARAVEKAGYAWGCDLCQRACPHNQNVPPTPLRQFRADLISTLAPADLQGLSPEAFAAKYGDRAYGWKGSAPLLRNLKLL